MQSFEIFSISLRSTLCTEFELESDLLVKLVNSSDEYIILCKVFMRVYICTELLVLNNFFHSPKKSFIRNLIFTLPKKNLLDNRQEDPFLVS